MFEDYTYELLLDDVLNSAPEGVDTRQGSIFYDAVSGILIKVAKLYTDLDLIFELTQLDTATGEYLDKKVTEFGLTRQQALPAKYYVTFTGTIPDIGQRFFTDTQYFTLRKSEDGVYYLQAEVSGIVGNIVYEETPAVPVNNISGLVSATFGAIMEYGTDAESDDSLRNRVREKIAGPAENGNKQHYKTWCEQVDGVGLARMFPLWNGPNTVKGVLINPLGKPCGEVVVNAVQQYIDPNDLGHTTVIDGKKYVVGDGLGEGIANLGAHFTAVAADETKLNISFDAELASGTEKESAMEEVAKAIELYFTELTMDTVEAVNVVVRISMIGSIISGVPSILDYRNLTINNSNENIAPGEDNVPVLGEVVLNVL